MDWALVSLVCRMRLSIGFMVEVVEGSDVVCGNLDDILGCQFW